MVTLNFTAPQVDVVTVNGDISTTSASITLSGSVTTVSIVVQTGSGASRTYVVTIAATLAQDAYVKASTLSSRFGQSVAISTDGTTMVVGAYMENGGGAAYVYRSDGGVWAQQARIVASNRENNDFFGTSVAINGNGTTIAVGANGEDGSGYGVNGNQSSNTASFSGAVYVFKFTTNWAQESYLKAANSDANDQFGVSVSLSDDGNALAIGSPNESSDETAILPANQLNGGDNNASQSGAAYIYRRNTTWAPVTYFKAPNCGAGDNFGRSVALSGDGNTLAVGAIQEDGEDGGFTSIGAVYVFKSTGGDDWDTPEILRGAAATNYFGTSVAIDADGDTLAVGARGESSVASFSGAAFLYSFDGGAWSAPTVLKAPTPRMNDEMGGSIALSRDGLVCVVGSEQESNTSTGIDNQTGSWVAANSGAAYVFARQGNAWARDAYLKASNAEADDLFGHGVAVSGNGRTIAVCASEEASASLGINGNQSDNSSMYSGAGYLFSR